MPIPRRNKNNHLHSNPCHQTNNRNKHRSSGGGGGLPRPCAHPNHCEEPSPCSSHKERELCKGNSNLGNGAGKTKDDKKERRTELARLRQVRDGRTRPGRGCRHGARGEWEGDIEDDLWWPSSPGLSETPLTTSTAAGNDELWDAGLQAEHDLYGPDFGFADIVRLSREGFNYRVRVDKSRREPRWSDNGGLEGWVVPVVRGGLGSGLGQEEQEAGDGWRDGWDEDKEDDGVWETWDIFSVAESWCVLGDGDGNDSDQDEW